MSERMTVGMLAALAIALGVSSCRKDGAPQEVAKEASLPSDDTNFTPPEIRRPAPSADTPPESERHVAEPSPDSVSRVSVPAPSATARAVSAPARPPKAEPSNPSSPAPSPASADPGAPGQEGDWVLQVNIHKSEADARAQIAKLAAKGIPAYAVPVSTEGAKLAGQYWRVRVGRFLSRADAQAYGDRMVVPAGLKFWIDRKSNEHGSSETP